jgi:hypothetical protein
MPAQRGPTARIFCRSYPAEPVAISGSCRLADNFAAELRDRTVQARLEGMPRPRSARKPSTKSATVSDGRQSNMGQREGSPSRFPTNFASLPKRTFDQAETNRLSLRFKPIPTRSYAPAFPLCIGPKTLRAPSWRSLFIVMKSPQIGQWPR